MEAKSKSNAVVALIVSLVICYATSSVGAIASIRARSFYAELTQPAWAPPGWVFGPVWTLLYGMMAVAAWLVWRKGGIKVNRVALTVFLVQLAVNALWSWLFFAWQMGGAAFADIIFLWICIVAMIALFWRSSRVGAALLVPYLLWVTFATVLNYAMWQLNPDILG